MARKSDGKGNETYTCDQCGRFIGNSRKDVPKSHNISWSREAIFCSDGCKNSWLKDNGGNNANSGNSSNNSSETAEAKIEKRKMDLEEEKIREENSLKRSQQELEEKKNRQRRADELRAQGKTTQAFFVEHGVIVGVGIMILLIGLFIGFNALTSKSNTKEGSEINLKLEGIEDKLRIAIQEGNKEKALELANQLVHPLHEKDETKKFDAMTGYPMFDEEWATKREEYKTQIMSMNGQSNEKESLNIEESTTSDKKETEELPVNSNDQQILVGNLTNALKGEWIGDFGGKELLISLNDVDLGLEITGYDEVKGNRRDLKGDITDNGNNMFTINLKEPGDDKWDGAFNIKYTDGENTMTGIWTANNGKAKKEFKLTKK